MGKSAAFCYLLRMDANKEMERTQLHVCISCFSLQLTRATCHKIATYYLSASYSLVFCSTLHSRITKIKNIINLVWLFCHVLVII